MEAWFLYACVSALFAGLQAVVQKVAIERGLSTVLVNSYGALISGSIAFIILLLSGQPFSITWYAAIIIFMSGAAYMYGVVSRSRAMRYLDVGVVLTSYKSITLLTTVLAGVIFFFESPSGYEWIGILLAAAVPFLLAEHPFRFKREALRSDGFVLLGVAVAMGTLSMTLTKLGTSLVDSMLLFTACNHLFAGFYGMGQQIATHRGDWHKQFLDYRHSHVELAFTAVLGGAAQCAGFFALLMAFSLGPLSTVYAVNSVYIIIPILFAMWYYKERMTFFRMLAILLSIVSVVLLK